MNAKLKTSDALYQTVDVNNSLAYMGSILSFLVPSDKTGGRLSVLIAHSRPGSEPPPHVHNHEHEVYYLIEGEVDFFVEGTREAIHAKPGGMVFLPSGKAHAMYFRCPARFVTVIHGVEGHDVTTEAYLKTMAIGPAESLDLPPEADRYATIDPADMARAFKLAADHGVTFLTPEETAIRLPNYPGFGIKDEAA